MLRIDISNLNVVDGDQPPRYIYTYMPIYAGPSRSKYKKTPQTPSPIQHDPLTRCPLDPFNPIFEVSTTDKILIPMQPKKWSRFCPYPLGKRPGARQSSLTKWGSDSQLNHSNRMHSFNIFLIFGFLFSFYFLESSCELVFLGLALHFLEILSISRLLVVDTTF